MSAELEDGAHGGGADIHEVVDEAIRIMARKDVDRLRDDMDLAADLGFDSLRLIELAVVIEQRCGLPALPLDSSLTVSTVGDVYGMVDRLGPGERQ
jgi:acyl carrier protein